MNLYLPMCSEPYCSLSGAWCGMLHNNLVCIYKDMNWFSEGAGIFNLGILLKLDYGITVAMVYSLKNKAGFF